MPPTKKPKKSAKRSPRQSTKPAPWPFHAPRNLVTMSLRRIFFGTQPFLYASHEPDGMWQLLDNEPVTMKDHCLVGLEEAIKRDPTLLQLATLPIGWYAIRESVGSPWWVAPKGVSIHDHYESLRKKAGRSTARSRRK